MQIHQPERQAIYCHLQKDTKKYLNELAKYHRTSLTNLMEQGAQMVIRSHLKQIQAKQNDYDHLSRTAINW